MIRKPVPLAEKLASRIARRKGDVFLPGDFADLGGYVQVSRALRGLVQAGRLTRIGRGLYARASTSPFDGAVIPAKGLYRLTEEALGRLGVKTGLTDEQRAYSEGRTTQVPAGRVIGVDRRIRRTIGFNGATMAFERV